MKHLRVYYTPLYGDMKGGCSRYKAAAEKVQELVQKHFSIEVHLLAVTVYVMVPYL